MRNHRVGAAAAMLALTGVLTLNAAPAQAAPEPERKSTSQVRGPAKPTEAERNEIIAKLRKLNAPETAITAVKSGTYIGWDDKGPYLHGWAPYCDIHLFIPIEWIFLIPGASIGGSGCWTF
ncbi:hypothetical protein EDD29_5060 [Actinocorallia herbida]|uniref:Uncharacterized protein n=1 Tax=Actinocorallia herbida TaxID=58109 RepID=A0A3N1D1R4_9ACTN|nr:hypothetical protein [Actinocorallia herbida]ROO87452.1 hypothetical protein EDD29_5060 [Actinocorallia herbida]